jgi:tRNA (cytidine56-2'-O)-methyltransferase
MIIVLRIGHRPARDKRITTHVALTARAFGADEILIDTKDDKLEATISGVIDRFGGSFKVKSGVNWRKFLKSWHSKIVHLTMYGEHIDEVIKRIPMDDNILIIVGSEKVPAEVYSHADFNIAVGHQPHSEVAALAIFLDRFFKGEALKKEFKGKLTIHDSPKGKVVVETQNLKSNWK